MHGEAAAGAVVTAEQFAEWMEKGTNPPTVEELRAEFLAMNAIRQAMMESLDKLLDDLTADSDKALIAIAYRAERASEYAVITSIIQRLADIALVAKEAAQR